jgi:hypothetical protein
LEAVKLKAEGSKHMKLRTESGYFGFWRIEVVISMLKAERK